jgi:transposase-like protein
VAAHLQKAAVERALLADEHRVHRGLHVVVDPARARPPPEDERPVMGVEHHLLRLARIGPDERHAAVAEPQVRHLHRGGDAGDQHHLVAPVELIRLARIEDQRHERRSKAPNRVVATLVAALVAEAAQKRELQRAQMERDILKKAALIFGTASR